MTYSLKDVDAAEEMVRSEYPQVLISRGDYDWSLAIADGERSVGFILFQCGDDRQPEIVSSLEEIRDICFLLGNQWTPAQLVELNTKRASKP